MLTTEQETLLNTLKEIAKEQVRARIEFKEFTGLIGELAACKELEYKWTPRDGYDAIKCKASSDKTNQCTHKTCTKIQIKTRKVWSSPNFTTGTLGRFGKKNNYDEFDIGILVLLDKDFEIDEIWELKQADIKARESRKDERHKAMKISKFIQKPAKPKIQPNKDYTGLSRQLRESKQHKWDSLP